MKDSAQTSWRRLRWLLLVMCAFPPIFTTCTCEAPEPGQAEGEQSSRLSPHQLPGLVIGQVASQAGPAPSRPITSIDGVEIGMRFRRAVRDLSMFEDEGGPGPTINFVLTWSLGRVPATPDDIALGHTGDFMMLLLEAEGEATGRSAAYSLEVRGIYRERITTAESVEETADRIVNDGVADLVGAIRLEAAPRVAPDDEVVAMLSLDTPVDALLPALREVYRRRIPAGAPAARELLSHPDVEVIIAAANVSGRLRDAAALEPLLDLIYREHEELTEYVFPILGQIGSEDARRYLEIVSSADDNPYLQRLARQVLQDYFESRR